MKKKSPFTETRGKKNLKSRVKHDPRIKGEPAVPGPFGPAPFGPFPPLGPPFSWFPPPPPLAVPLSDPDRLRQELQGARLGIIRLRHEVEMMEGQILSLMLVAERLAAKSGR